MLGGTLEILGANLRREEERGEQREAAGAVHKIGFGWVTNLHPDRVLNLNRELARAAPRGERSFGNHAELTPP